MKILKPSSVCISQTSWALFTLHYFHSLRWHAHSATVTEPANYMYTYTRGPIKGFISILSLAMWDILLVTKWKGGKKNCTCIIYKVFILYRKCYIHIDAEQNGALQAKNVLSYIILFWCMNNVTNPVWIDCRFCYATFYSFYICTWAAKL